ncbi:MAG: hydroxyhydroquinone dehydrogenase BtdL [Acidobacteria bacterium]|nr:hydroxyhydroquinone dehydrogenase BtdL [Acidobacteriota bacterium]
MSNPNKLKVGFYGLGRMGRGMARRIFGDGHEIIVYDVVRAQTEEFAAAGVKVASTIGEASAGRDVVVTMLPDDAVLNGVVLDSGGIRASMPAGGIHLAMGTHGIATIRALAAAHAETKQVLVAAPVLGRPDLAATGQLGIVAAGPPEAVTQCEPLFKVMGRQTLEAGPIPESALAIKLANNFLLGCAIEAMAEAFSLVRKYGVAPEVLYHVMTEGLFSAPAYRVYGKIIVDESYDKPGFTTLLGLKDFNLIMAAADMGRIPLPSGNAFRDRLLSAIAHGEGEKDWAVVAREQASTCGLD